MRFTAFVAVALASLLACSPATCDEPEQAKKDLSTLGERFLDSLKEDNVVAYSQCWVSLSVAKRVAKDANAGEDDQKEMPAMFRDRDRVIARQFQPLRDRLRALSKDLVGIKLETVSARRIEEWYGVKMWDDMTVVLQVDSDTIVKIEMARAGQFGGDWYFVAPPERSITVLNRLNRDECKDVDVMTGREETWFPTREMETEKRTENGAPPISKESKGG